MPRSVWSLLALSLMACSKGGASAPAKQPDGSYRLSCTGPLTACLQRAERLCRDQGYTVAEGRDMKELLGHESGESQVEIHKSDATIYCGNTTPSAERPIIELKRDAPVSALPATAKAAPLTCVPGTTQACVGPAGCHGGQACAPDGSRYEACDCGSPSPSPSP